MAFVVYGSLALAAYWPIWPGDPARIPSCACGDQVQQVWFLAWTPLALLHGHDPFLTNFIDYPTGANMAVNTLMPALGLLGAPFTLLLGAVSTLNFWLWLSFPLSATACFVLLRRWVRWAPAAFVGGLLYGFSPYMVGQGAGHLNLTFVPLPPIVLLLADELLIRQRRPAFAIGAALGVAGAVEYLVTPEVFASTLVLAAIGTALLALARPRMVASRARRAAPGAAAAVATCGALLGYPLYLQVVGPDHFTGSAHGSYPFAADLLGLVVPTVHQLVAPSDLVAVSNRFILGDVAENGSYLGVSLLLALAAVVVWRWRLPLVRFSFAMAVAAEVLALGPALTVGAHVTDVPLPDRLLDRLPFFGSFVFARFSLYVDLFAAVLLAVGIDHVRLAWRRASVERQASVEGQAATARRARGGRLLARRADRWWGPAALAAVLAVVLVPLVPDWPYPSFPSVVPSLFTTAAVDRVPAGSVVLTYPYVQDSSDEGELWQVRTGMRFRLLGGYALVPGPGGAASYDPFPPALVSVPATLTADAEGTTPGGVVAGATAASPAEVRRFIERYRVGTVIVDPVGAHPGAALALLRSAIGRAPDRAGGLDVWFGVQRRAAAGTAGR